MVAGFLVLTLGLIGVLAYQAVDATREFQDLRIRLDTAEKALQRLVDLLEKAGNVEEVLLIEKEIHRLTEEVERLKGTLRHLADRIAFSTIEVEFRSSASEPSDRRVHEPW